MTDLVVEYSGWGDGERDLVFLSYSHADAVWAQRFQVMLAPLMRPRRSASLVDTEGNRAGAARLELWIDADRFAAEMAVCIPRRGCGRSWRRGAQADPHPASRRPEVKGRLSDPNMHGTAETAAHHPSVLLRGAQLVPTRPLRHS